MHTPATARPAVLHPRALRAAWLWVAVAAAAAGQPVLAPQPLLPEQISSRDVLIRGRFVRQWREDDGTFVLLLPSGVSVDFGERHFEARQGVVWIRPRKTAQGRPWFELSVYLAGQARVREPGGTTIEDVELLVSDLRTFGRIIKQHDAHAPEPARDHPLYQRALGHLRTLEQPRQAPPPPEPTVIRPGREAPGRQRKPRIIRYQLPNIEPATTPDGRRVFVSTGRVYFSQTGGPDAPVLEILADNAVVFPAVEEQPAPPPATATAPAASELHFRRASGRDARRYSVEDGGQPPPAGTEDGGQPPPAGQSPLASELRVRRDNPQREGEPSVPAELTGRIEGVYLEGDVVVTFGERFIRAERLYYDFARQRALILDAVFRTELPKRGVPLYVRADEIRQLSEREFAAEHARVSTSEFYTPHYHLGVERVYLRDRTPRDASGRPAGPLAGTYDLRDVTLNVANVPILYWPRVRGDLETSETLIRRVRIGQSRNFGTEVETVWELFGLLGRPRPEGVDARLRLDYFSDRGPAIGIDADYTREDSFGLLRGYYINDGGEDNLGPLRDNRPDSPNRGRILWRHRQYLPEGWEATFELSYISDPGFLEEYEKSEWFESKAQETVFYLKHTGETDALTLLANWRTLDFVTQTEHLPDLAYRRIGDVLFDSLVLYHESHVGAVRYRPDDRRLFDGRRFDNTARTDVTARATLRQEAELPLKLPGASLVPFATVHGQYWDGQPLDSGRLWRGVGIYGVRGGSWLAKVFDDVDSRLLDLHRLRHIIQPYFASWYANSNTTADRVTPFDPGIETIGSFYGTLVGVRQTLQTKRGGPGQWRTVDWLTFDLQAGFFGGDIQDPQDAPGIRIQRAPGYVNFYRPELSHPRNYLAGELIWRIGDTTSLLYDFNFDLNDRSFDRHNVSLAVERLPRLAYVFGLRHAGDIETTLMGGGFNYRLTAKHTLAYRSWFDIDRGDLGQIAIGYVRRLPRWYLAVSFEFDSVFDDFRVSLSLWPEGIPEWTLGSSRFTGLARGTGIRP